MKYIKKHYKKVILVVLVFVMTMTGMGQGINVLAAEIHKVRDTANYGEKYQVDLNANQKDRNLRLQQDSSYVSLDKEIVADTLSTNEQPENEIVEKRTENSKTYKKDDGSYVEEVYSEPIHLEEDGVMEEIDNTLEVKRDDGNSKVLTNKKGLYELEIEDNTIKIEDDIHALIFNYPSANMSQQQKNGNVVYYNGFYQNIDMEYRLRGSSILSTFIINGPIQKDELEFEIDKGNLTVEENHEALLFKDGETTIFAYTKPISLDAKGKRRENTVTWHEENDIVKISIAFDEEWLEDSSRIFPVKMAASTVEESATADISSAYVRELEPIQTSTYSDLFVGYEDGYISGLPDPIGITRTYINISGLQIASDKEIISADLNLYKPVAYAEQWNTIEASKTDYLVDTSTVNWNNKPTDLTFVSTNQIEANIGYQKFDVTSYIKDVYEGKSTTLQLKSTNESDSVLSNVFYSESGLFLPAVSISYRDAWDVDINLDIDIFDTEMRIYTKKNADFYGLSFDGIAKPDSLVKFDLVPKLDNTVVQSETSRGNSNRYFVDPVFYESPISNVQTYTKGDVNYTTDYILENRIPQFNKPYEYKMSIDNAGTTSTRDFKSDGFIKYKVQNGDNLAKIASYYGITVDQLIEDNNKDIKKVKQGDILFIRFKKDNPKVSKDIYTPPVRTVTYEAKYVNRGPRCYGGMCPTLDPVDSSTGNFYTEDIDFTIKTPEDLNFIRYYNSVGPNMSNPFGNGFTTVYDSYITYDKDDNMLVFLGDGKIFEIPKVGDTYVPKSVDQLDVTMNGDNVTVHHKLANHKFMFDEYGMLESYEDENLRVHKLSRNDTMQVTEVDIDKKKLAFNYNDNNLISDVYLPSGKSVSYKYDEHRNLISFEDLKGNIKTYTYDANNFMTTTSDFDGAAKTINTYDASGRVIKQVDGNGNTSTIEYTDTQSKVTHADASVDVYHFNSNYDITKIEQGGNVVSENTYDANRNLLTKTNSDGDMISYTYQNDKIVETQYPDGTKESYTYDDRGNLVTETQRDGNTVSYTYNDKNFITSMSDDKDTSSTNTYDDEGRLISETDSLGFTKTYAYTDNMVKSITYSNGLEEYYDYDANGNIVKESDNQGKNTTYIYNSNNELIQKNYSDGTNEQWVYDNNANVVQFKNRINGVTNFTYDKKGNELSSTNGSVSTSKTYNEIDQLIKEVDEQGRVKTYSYDLSGNKVSESDIYGNDLLTKYDANSNIIETVDARGNSKKNIYQEKLLIETIDEMGLSTKYEYDDLQREVKVIYPNGNESTKEYTGFYLTSEVDERGILKKNDYNAFGQLVEVETIYPEGLSTTTTMKYDSSGNLIESDVDGATTKYVYDCYDQQIEVIDPEGNRTKSVYDLDGNIVEEIDALGNSKKTVFDAVGNELKVTDKRGNSTSKTYNSNSQLVSEEDELGYIKTYEYNNLGQLVKLIDPYQIEMTYSYDQFGNQLETVLDGKIVESNTYNNFGDKTSTKTVEESTSYVYDTFGRVVQETNELTKLSKQTTYDNYGNVIETKLGNKIEQFEYDKHQQKTKTTDAYGRSETVEYDSRGNALTTKQFDGTTVTSVYDVKGNVVESKDAIGVETMNEYSENNLLTKQKIAGVSSTFTYDANGQLLSTTRVKDGATSTNQYDANGNIIRVIDVLGNITVKKYDDKNQEISITDPRGHTSSKEYDAYGNVIKETNALGDYKQFKYDSMGLLEEEVDERGFSTTYEYNEDFKPVKKTDGNGNVVKFKYDEANRVKEELYPNGATKSYTYDDYSRVLKETNPLGLVTSFEYDMLDNVVLEVYQDKKTKTTFDEFGNQTKVEINGVVQEEEIYNKLNQVTQMIDASGNKTDISYDHFGHEIKRNHEGRIVETKYDELNRVQQTIENTTLVKENVYNKADQVVSELENGTTLKEVEFDENGNTIKSIEKGVEIRFEFDELNRQVKVSIPSSDKDKEFVAIETVIYDEVGNPIEVNDAFGNQTSIEYDANNNKTKEVAKNGAVSKYEYDSMNNLIKAQNNEERFVEYLYDKNNRLVTKKTNLNFASYDYDDYGNQIKEVNEYGYKSEYKYDIYGNKVSVKNPDGSEIKSTFDALGNELTRGSNTYTYDAFGNVLIAKNETGTVTNTYNDFDQLISVVDTNDKEIRYSYDDANNMIEKQFDGETQIYRYDENKNLIEVLENDHTVASYTYNNRNEEIKLVQNKFETSKTYDTMGRITSQITTKGDEKVLDASYSYDANDNLVSEVIDGKENKYTYDLYDQLVQSEKYIEGKLTKTKYTYDVFGNQTVSDSEEGNKTHQYNSKGQLESITGKDGVSTYNYDKNGNLIRQVQADGRIDKYTYEDNQLVSLRQGQYIYDYSYDAQGERVKQVVTDTKDYHYDVWYDYTTTSSYTYVAEFTSVIDDLKVKVKDKEENGTVCEYATETYYGPINGITSKDVLRNKDAFYFKEPVETTYLLDRQQEYTQVIKENNKKYVYGTALIKEDKEDIVTGWNNSVVLKTDKEKTKKMSYNDYGISKDTTQGLGYNSEMQDATGLIYLRARYYDPKTARFVQVDNNYDGEKDHIGSQNKYAYTLGNPYKYVDRDGNRAFISKVIGKIIPKVIGNVSKIVNVISGGLQVLNNVSQVARNINTNNSAQNYSTHTLPNLERISPYGNHRILGHPKRTPRTYKISHTQIAVASCAKGEEKGLLAKTWDGFKNGVSNVWNGGKQVVKDVWDWGAEKLSTVGGWIANNVDKILIGAAIILVASGAGLVLIGGVGGLLGIFGGAGVAGLSIAQATTFATLGGISAGLGSVVATIKGHFYGFTDLDNNLVKAGLMVMSVGQLVPALLNVADAFNQSVIKGSGPKLSEEIKFGSDVKSSTKLNNQMNKRGWTVESVKDTVDNSFTTRVSNNLATGNSATVYYSKSGAYVIIDDITKEIVQVSDALNPLNWKPDLNIINPFIPEE